MALFLTRLYFHFSEISGRVPNTFSITVQNPLFLISHLTTESHPLLRLSHTPWSLTWKPLFLLLYKTAIRNHPLKSAYREQSVSFLSFFVLKWQCLLTVGMYSLWFLFLFFYWVTDQSARSRLKTGKPSLHFSQIPHMPIACNGMNPPRPAPGSELSVMPTGRTSTLYGSPVLD